VLSEKKEHQLAKKHVESAIRKLEVLERNKENESLLAIAYFTLGCQQEFLEEYEQSFKSYTQACKLECHKKQSESLIREFRSSVSQVSNKLRRQNRGRSGSTQSPEPG
jgi:Sec7-like guanine-nucleotide exchange factor